MLAAPVLYSGNDKKPRPFCGCWAEKTPVSWRKLDRCGCGEIDGAGCEWVWEASEDSDSSLLLSDDRKQVTFHPFYSTGTAVVKGGMPFVHNNHYYWEVKVLTETYGTDIIIGVGTSNLDVNSAKFTFESLLGSSEESYGLSYTGKLRHMDWEIRNEAGFCRGTIVGVRVDMWRGTLEFYLNRKPQGISFYNLRRHKALYPMISSTAAQSSMRLVYAGSHRGSLLVDALKTLAASARRLPLPPGLLFTSTTQFWLSLPTDGDGADSENVVAGKEAVKSNYAPLRTTPPEPRYGMIPIRGDEVALLPVDADSRPSSPSSTSSVELLTDIFYDLVFAGMNHTFSSAKSWPSVYSCVFDEPDSPDFVHFEPQTPLSPIDEVLQEIYNNADL